MDNLNLYKSFYDVVSGYGFMNTLKATNDCLLEVAINIKKFESDLLLR